jgi:hypothetical protein
VPVGQSESGVFGHLAPGWPASPMARAAHARVMQDRTQLPLRDRLLRAIAWDMPADEERAAREVAARRYPAGR